MAVEAVNNNPWISQGDFQRFFMDIYDDLTGRQSTLEERGVTVLSDGTKIANLVQVSVKDPNAIPICNETGAKFLIHHIRLLFNKHVMMGNLGHDELVDMAEDAVAVPINMMMYEPKEYGVGNTTKLESEGLSLFDPILIFLTSIEKGGMRDWGREILDIKIENRNAPTQQPQQQAGLYA